MTYLKDKKFINAVKYIYEHIDQPIQLKNIAEEVGVSLSTLKRLFIEATDKPVGAFIRRLRMELAFCTLQNRKDNVLESALRVGFVIIQLSQDVLKRLLVTPQLKHAKN